MSALRKVLWTGSRFVSQNCGPFSHALYHLASVYTKTFQNLNYDIKTNGEDALLARLSKVGLRTVFDVGANKGEYTSTCLEKFRDAEVHAFEIIPDTYKSLSQNITTPRARLNGFGLADYNGSAKINFSAEADRRSSLIEGAEIHDGTWIKLDVRVETGDHYCDRHDISSIDLLKIDVEGAEDSVLRGFSGKFERGLISAVQFEFGLVNIYSKFLLMDFFRFFVNHEFKLGPIMPKGVQFRPHNSRDENFQGPPNFFAVHRSRSDIIKAVAIK